MCVEWNTSVLLKSGTISQLSTSILIFDEMRQNIYIFLVEGSHI